MPLPIFFFIYLYVLIILILYLHLNYNIFLGHMFQTKQVYNVGYLLPKLDVIDKYVFINLFIYYK